MDDSAAAIASQVSKLIKPIRELASNWDIDIAFELEDYFTKISQIDFEINGKQYNFAEAALLIQGSAAIYSKKVEYLYTLIFRTLDLVTQQENAKNRPVRQATSIREDGKDSDVFEDEELEFLSLDDIVENNMADNIDLDEDWDIDVDGKSFNSKRSKGGLNSDAATSQHRATLKFAFALGGGSSSSSTQNFDTPSIDNPRINGSDFRMNSCLLSSNGALMLGSSIDLFSSPSFRSGQSDENSSSTTMSMDHNNHSQNDNTQNANQFGENMQSSDFNSSSNIDFNTDTGNYDDDDDDNDGGYIPDIEPANVPRSPEPTTSLDSLLNSEQASKLRGSDKELLQAVIDPWTFHDPHDPGSAPAKPFKKGRTYKLPNVALLNQAIDFDKLDQVDSKKHNSEAEELVAGISTLNLNFGLFKPFFSEFAYIFEEETKRKQGERLKQRKEAIKAIAAQEGISVEDSSLHLEDNEDDIGNWNTDTGNYDDDDDDNDGFGYIPDAAPSWSSTNDAEIGDAGYSAPESEHVTTYEEHCKARLEEYFRSAQQYVQETELSARIEEWNSRLAPLLQEQESRPVFDIHEYGSKLIRMFPEEERLKLEETDPTETVVVAKLDDMLAGAPAYEVCRSFSSLLQLANFGNIKINQSRNEEGLHDISLQLLTTQPRIDMETFIPSNQPQTSSKTNTKSDKPSKSRKSPKKSKSQQPVAKKVSTEKMDLDDSVVSGTEEVEDDTEPEVELPQKKKAKRGGASKKSAAASTAGETAGAIAEDIDKQEKSRPTRSTRSSRK